MTAVAGPDPQKVRRALTDARYELEIVLDKIERARKDWETLADFLRAQGIKPDISSMPLFDKLLLLSRDPAESDVVVGEIQKYGDENDDDDDDD